MDEIPAPKEVSDAVINRNAHDKKTTQISEVPVRIEDTLKKLAATQTITDVLEERTDYGKKTIINKLKTQLNYRRIPNMAIAAGILALGINSADALAGERPELTPEVKKIVEEVTGTSMTEAEEKFKIRIPVKPDKDGKYIVSLGMLHRPQNWPQDSARAARLQDRIISVQQNIEGVLLNTLTANNIDCIFSEDVTDEETMPSLRDYIKDTKKRIGGAMEKPIRTYSELDDAYNHFNIYNMHINEPYIYHYLGNDLKKLSEKIFQAFDEVPIPAEVNSIDIDKMKKHLQSRGKLAQAGEKPNPYMVGADFKLLMEGKVQTLCPAEDWTTNQQSAMADRQLTQAELEYQTKRDELWINEYSLQPGDTASLQSALDNDPRLSELGKRKIEMQTNFNSTLSERNHVLLKKIDSYDQKDRSTGKPLNHRVSIYGYTHHIAPELLEWNATNPQGAIDRGLIELTPK